MSIDWLAAHHLTAYWSIDCHGCGHIDFHPTYSKSRRLVREAGTLGLWFLAHLDETQRMYRWLEAHHPWSKGSCPYAPSELLQHLVDIVIPLQEVLTVPEVAPIHLPTRAHSGFQFCVYSCNCICLWLSLSRRLEVEYSSWIIECEYANALTFVEMYPNSCLLEDRGCRSAGVLQARQQNCQVGRGKETD